MAFRFRLLKPGTAAGIGVFVQNFLGAHLLVGRLGNRRARRLRNLFDDPNWGPSRCEQPNGACYGHAGEAQFGRRRKLEALAQNIVELMEAYPGVSVGEVFNAFFVVQKHPDLSPGEVLEAFHHQFRESHVNLIVERLKDLKATVAKAKTKIGTSKNLKSDEQKREQPKQKFAAVSGSVGQAIAVASSGVVGGKRKNKRRTASATPSVAR